MIIDAGGMCCFENNKQHFLTMLHENCILLPHEGEFYRLFSQQACKITSVLEASQQAKTTILLKGSDTVIASPEGVCYINTNAPPTLATAGTGDVLAGMVAGFSVQKCLPLISAAAATWIQAEAAKLFGPGLIAEDIIDNLPSVLKRLRNSL